MVKELIAKLKDASGESRGAACEELRQFARSGSATIEDAVALIEAATGEFPAAEHAWEDASAPLLWAARGIAEDKDPSRLLPVVEGAFARLSPEGRRAALQIVVVAGTPTAARLYVRMLKEYGESLGSGPLQTFEQSKDARVAYEIFPEALELVRNSNLAYHILHMLLKFREADLVPPDIAREFHDRLVEGLETELAAARKLQRPTGLGWRDEEPYSAHRDLIGLLFDLAGALSSKSLLKVVAGAGDLLDPRLRRFRAIALLRARQEVPQSELDWIARSPRDRYWLFDQLHMLGMAERLPSSCRDQEQLAEGHMVDWLCFGTELGREPDEIVLFHRESRNRSDARLLVRWLTKRQPVDYYFFKFRVTEEHWAKEDGWMVGMAGGYARRDQPTTTHDGGTFSKFEAFDSKSVAEHVADYLE